MFDFFNKSHNDDTEQTAAPADLYQKLYPVQCMGEYIQEQEKRLQSQELNTTDNISHIKASFQDVTRKEEEIR